MAFTFPDDYPKDGLNFDPDLGPPDAPEPDDDLDLSDDWVD